MDKNHGNLVWQVLVSRWIALACKSGTSLAPELRVALLRMEISMIYYTKYS